jgi:hypothetical protein
MLVLLTMLGAAIALERWNRPEPGKPERIDGIDAPEFGEKENAKTNRSRQLWLARRCATCATKVRLT